MQTVRATITGLVLLASLSSPGTPQQPGPDARWELREVVRIGSVDGPDALASVRAVTVGGDGLVYISEGIAEVVRVYDSAGRLIRRLGGKGSGPGEFRSVGDLSWTGDTLIVADPALQRFSRFDSDGQFIETFRASAPGAALSVGILHDGTAVMRPRSRAYAQDPQLRMPLLRMRYPATEAADTIAWIRAYGSGACVNPGRRLTVCPGSMQFGTADIVKVDSRGRYIIIVSNLRAQERRRQSFVVSMIGPAGDTLMKSNVWYTPIPIPAIHTDSVIRDLTDRLMNPPDNRPALTRDEAAAVVRDGLQIPPSYPPVTDAVVARNGDVWLEVRLSTGGKGWIVLDRRGRRKADVASLDDVTLRAIDDLVWGVTTDDLNVPYVVGFELRNRA